MDPVDWPIAPAVGIKSMLSRFGLDPIKDIHKWEINEAFAMVVLANARILGLSEDFQVKMYSLYTSNGHSVKISFFVDFEPYYDTLFIFRMLTFMVVQLQLDIRLVCLELVSPTTWRLDH